ncbi:hypothetical protein Ciccas_006980 [Cichlidogyrus casuarinus]|uniref:Uncharacterized protein n=1 Tax=Cichlidogyrus casuarinus TaxID=1844966 RepID=A0ABD2Q5G6_9PLAT
MDSWLKFLVVCPARWISVLNNAMKAVFAQAMDESIPEDVPYESAVQEQLDYSSDLSQGYGHLPPLDVNDTPSLARASA